jgi:hypothetical protein
MESFSSAIWWNSTWNQERTKPQKLNGSTKQKTDPEVNPKQKSQLMISSKQWNEELKSVLRPIIITLKRTEPRYKAIVGRWPARSELVRSSKEKNPFNISQKQKESNFDFLNQNPKEKSFLQRHKITSTDKQCNAWMHRHWTQLNNSTQLRTSDDDKVRSQIKALMTWNWKPLYYTANCDFDPDIFLFQDSNHPKTTKT